MSGITLERVFSRRAFLSGSGAAALYGWLWWQSSRGKWWSDEGVSEWVREGFKQRAEKVLNSAKLAQLNFKKESELIIGNVVDPDNGRTIYFEHREAGGREKVYYFTAIDKVNLFDDVLLNDLKERGKSSLMVSYGEKPLREGKPLITMGEQTWQTRLDNFRGLKKYTYEEYVDLALVDEVLQREGVIEISDVRHVFGSSYGAVQAMQAGLLSEVLGKRVDRWCGWAGPYDLAHISDSGMAEDWLRLERLSRREMWCSSLVKPWKTLAMMSPTITMGTLKPTAEAVTLLSGLEDRVISYDNTVHLYEVLKESGIPTEMYLLRDTDHFPASQSRQDKVFAATHDSELMTIEARSRLKELQQYRDLGPRLLLRLAGI